MRKRLKNVFKKIFKTGKWVFIFGIVLLIGIAIGAENSTTRQSVVIYNESGDPLNPEQVITIERHVDEHFVDEIVIPPIPDMPEMPEMPEMPTAPQMPEIPPIPNVPTTIYVDSGPSFFEVVSGVSTILAALGMIGVGIILLTRGRRVKEKSPESLVS